MHDAPPTHHISPTESLSETLLPSIFPPTATHPLQVENGKGAMPAWAGRLDEDQIESVANWVFKQVGDHWQ